MDSESRDHATSNEETGTETDDDYDHESGSLDEKENRTNMSAITGRGVTISMLLESGIIEPKNNILSLEYLGQKFTADLLADGDIRYVDGDGDKRFSSPSAWAIYCKRQETSSVCPSPSVSSVGADVVTSDSRSDSPVPLNLSMRTTVSGAVTSPACSAATLTSPLQRVPLKHSALMNADLTHDPKTLVECATFNELGKIQPYTIAISASCQLLMDFHSHLTSSEIIGYLGGKWNPDMQHMTIEQAYPCRCRLADAEMAAEVEQEIAQRLYRAGQTLVGWYHSHPSYQPQPSLRDVQLQMNYQLQMKGAGALDYYPCVGFIISPYDAACSEREAATRAFWVMPPPDGCSDYGIPMEMTFTQGSEAPKDSQQLLNEIQQLLVFYKGAPDTINFSLRWKSTTYFEKLRYSLSKKLPGDGYSNQFLDFLRNCLNA